MSNTFPQTYYRAIHIVDDKLPFGDRGNKTALVWIALELNRIANFLEAEETLIEEKKDE